MEDLDLIPGLESSSGGGLGDPLQYSCPESLHGQRSLVGYSPGGCKEFDTTATKHTSMILVAQAVNSLSPVQETRVPSLGWEDPLEKEMAAQFSILAWKIPWTVEPCRLPSMGSQRVGHD